MRRTLLIVVCLAAGGQAAPRAASLQGAILPVSQPAEARQILDKYCVTCHNARRKTAGLALDTLDLSQIPDHSDVWEKVVRKLRVGAMPPVGAPRPDEATARTLVSSLEATLDAAAALKRNPGRAVLHRLNRAEYANAIRDLLALDVDPGELLPPDDSSGGFDNNADVLGVSPALLEHYLSAARTVSALAVGDTGIGAATRTYRVRGDMSQNEHVDGLPFGTRGGLVVRHTFPVDGEYVIKVELLETTLAAIRGLEFPHEVEFLLDSQRIHAATVGGDADFTASAVNATDVVNSVAQRLTARVTIKAGLRNVGATFIAKTAAESGNRLEDFQRTTVDTTDHTGLPHVESLTIIGPFKVTGPGETSSRRRIFVCRPASPAAERSCATKIVGTLARRAYRRPVTDAEIARLMKFYEAGRRDANFDSGIERALRAMLASADFTFRVERDPATVAPGAAYRLSDLELASRLSFFLWSSIPDDELIDLASRGQLEHPGVLERQVRRMLADPRASTLVTNFASQWLQLRNLRTAIPDQNEFPDFDDNLRQAFRRETEMFVESVIREDRSVLDLLSADYTFVNERLARHYGMPNIYGSYFRRVPVADDARRGLLGKGAILMVTSHPDRTSPVLRGKWILENLLGTPPPPPPANVPALDAHGTAKPRTVREQMEAHRADPACASCHRFIDPLGFALENFDAVGAWRTRDAGMPVDATGQLLDGSRVNDVVTLRQALLRHPDVFAETFVEKLMIYAIGRGLGPYDGPAVRAIVRAAAAEGYRFSSVILGVVQSTPFQMRTKAPQADDRTGAIASAIH